MESESSFPGLEFIDNGFENKLYPCYSVRIVQKNKEVEIHKNSKCIQKISMSTFPKELDFNNIDHIAEIIATIRNHGLVGLMTKYQLKL